MTVLVNCSNLHSGGSVAVASSFVNLLAQTSDAAGFDVVASSAVDVNLRSLGTDTSSFDGYRVFDVVGLAALWKRFPVPLESYSTVFTVFGPLYRIRPIHRSVVGFAQPWIIYPSNEVHRSQTPYQRLRTRLKYAVQSAFFARADLLLVEGEHVKAALRQRVLFRRKEIRVIPNAVDPVHLREATESSIDLPTSNGRYRLGVVSRNYPHKNLEILPLVKQELSRTFGLQVDFFVTFTSEEWMGCSPAFRKEVLNVGMLNMEQSAAFNRQMDGVVFPSLLECFSATPLEALAAGVPLFASDRPFIRDTVGEHAHYFDPNSPTDIARVISSELSEPDLVGRSAAKEFVASSQSAGDRMRQYVLACRGNSVVSCPPNQNSSRSDHIG